MEFYAVPFYSQNYYFVGFSPPNTFVPEAIGNDTSSLKSTGSSL